MDQYIKELTSLLSRILNWSKDFKAGKKNYDFDVDSEMYKISKDTRVDFGRGDLNLIYNLLDFYCDAIKHGFKKIDRNYSVFQAQRDIQMILETMSKSSGVNLSPEIKERLKRL